MKAKLLKLLRGFSAQWISSETFDESIVGLLVTPRGHDAHYDPLTKYAANKGWVTSRIEGKYEQFYFTEKGRDEILIPLQEKTCITGRTIRLTASKIL